MTTANGNLLVWQAQLEFYGKISGTLWVWSIAAVFAGIGAVTVGSILTTFLFVATSVIWWAHAIIASVNVFKSMFDTYQRLTTWRQAVHAHNE